MASSSASTLSSTYSCGRCRQPLTLRTTSAASDSLHLLKESQYDLLASHIVPTTPSTTNDDGDDAAAAAARGAIYEAYNHRRGSSGNGSGSGSADLLEPRLGRKVVTLPPSALAKQTAQQKLFDSLSASTEVDHPLCSDCAEAWAASMGKEIDGLKQERDLLLDFDKDARRRREELERRTKEVLIPETARLEREEQELVRQLLDAEKRKLALDADLKRLEEEERELEAEEADFWSAHSRYLTAQNEHVQASRSLLLSYQSTMTTLEKLQRTNVYADAFCIGYDGGLATINGLRLGRLPSVQVEWAEINAAWGCTLLLLKTIAKNLECTINGYRLIPIGSFSKIEKVSGQGEKGVVMELYGSGDWALGRLLQNRRFDSAMVAFLECLRQVIEFAEGRAEEQNRDFRIPHQIHKDKIGDVSIRLGSSDETWTRALRHVLLDLKILLAESVR